MHACDLGAAFLSWASVLSRPPKAAAVPHRTNSDVRQSRRTTLRLLEALRLVVLHEPLGHAHHALRRWHELAKVGRSPRAALHERNERAWPPKGRLAPATRHRRSPPLGTEEREALVSVTSDDLHTLMETVADLQDQLRGRERALEAAKSTRARCEALQARCDELHARHDEMRARCDGVQAQRDGLQTERDGLQAQCGSLEAQRAALHARCQDAHANPNPSPSPNPNPNPSPAPDPNPNPDPNCCQDAHARLDAAAAELAAERQP